MPIRAAVPGDQDQMAVLAGKAFFDDELFGAIVHPHRNKFPDDMSIYCLQKIRADWGNPGNYFIVSTTTSSSGEEQVAAWGEWVRKGKHVEEIGNVAVTEEQAPLPPNRALDPDYADIFGVVHGYIADKWSGSREECWDLDFLATSPAYQGQGHGKLIVQWGIEKARQDRVTMSVISGGKDKFYHKLGFTIPGGHFTDGEGNPLKGRIEAGNIWWNDSFVKD